MSVTFKELPKALFPAICSSSCGVTGRRKYNGIIRLFLAQYVVQRRNEFRQVFQPSKEEHKAINEASHCNTGVTITGI